MRVLSLTSCGSLYLLASYIAFQHDATVPKTAEVTPTQQEVNPDNQYAQEVAHLQPTSRPEAESSASPRLGPAADRSLRPAGALSSPLPRFSRFQVRAQPGQISPVGISSEAERSPELGRHADLPASNASAEAMSPQPNSYTGEVGLATSAPLPLDPQTFESTSIPESPGSIDAVSTTETISEEKFGEIEATPNRFPTDLPSDGAQPAVMMGPSVDQVEESQFSSDKVLDIPNKQPASNSGTHLVPISDTSYSSSSSVSHSLVTSVPDLSAWTSPHFSN